MRSVILLALAACAGPERNIDRTVLTGTVVIPGVTVEEKDPNAAPNDADPQALGDDGSSLLTYRAVTLTGTTSSWVPDPGSPGPEDDELYGDLDLFGFTPVAGGTFTITVATADPGDDSVLYEVYVLDAAGFDLTTGEGILAGGSTAGSAGVYTIEWEATAGGAYVLAIAGVSSVTGEENTPWTAVLSGSTPPEGGFLIGVYGEGDPAVASNPLGGSTVTGWSFDAAALAWTGSYEILYLKSVEVIQGDSADTASATVVNVDEGPEGPLYLMAGTLSSLNATPSAGALYSSVAVTVEATGSATAVSEAVVLDALFPKVVGLELTETVPDETFAALDAEYVLIEDTLVAQDLGMLSGLGYVDYVDGATTLSGVDGWEGNDGDAYSFTVPESVRVRLNAAWADAADDIDFGIWGYYEGTGYIDYFSSFADSYCLTGANPEVCESTVALEPEVTYYLLALGYAGAAGDEPYHIELEWLAP